MLHKIFTSSLIFVLFSIVNQVTLFSEEEPNNDPSTANVLALNGSNSGSLSSGDLVDWWKVTTLVDGRLYIETISDTTVEVDLYIFDMDGTHEIARYDISFGTKETTHRNDLLPGTYYVKAVRWSGSGNYTIASQFTPAPYPNDAEVNDSANVAGVITLDTTYTGRLGFYSNNYTDLNDWWKVTIPSDGQLRIVTVSDTTLELDLFLYDLDGTHELASYDTSWGTNEATHRSDLMPGTYYIKALRWNGYGSYTFTALFTPARLPNDPEGNDSVSVARTFGLDSSATGHLGYYVNNYIDFTDWWKVTTTSDGNLTIRTLSDSTLELDLFLYDADMITKLADYDTSWGIREATHKNGLMPGTYYVKAYRFSGWGSYTITSIFQYATLTNDIEPNDSFQIATSATVQTIHTGHSGYYTNGYTERDDYFSFTLPSGWDTLFIRVDTEPTLEADLYLYDNTGAQIQSAGTFGTTEIIVRPNPTPANYYVNISQWTGYGSYAYLVTNVRPLNPLLGVEDDRLVNQQPNEHRLYQNYPNPFNPLTTIRFNLAKASHVRLTIYTILGEPVQTLLADEYRQVGRNEILFDAGHFASGVYFYRIQTKDFTATKAFTILK